MCLRWICVCVFYLLFETFIFTNGFNLNWKHALVYSDPNGQIGSYFGFTVALRQQGLTHWLVVGAPRGNSTYYRHEAIYQPGVVYQCNLQQGSTCEHLIVDSTGNLRIPNWPGSPVQHNKNNSWLGGAIAVQNNGERMVICAPRWKNSYHPNFYLMNGACYWTDDTTNPNVNMETLLPLVDRNRQSIKVASSDYFYYAYGGAGFTAHFPKNGTEFLLGAPGFYDWRGTIIRIRDSQFSEGSPRRRRGLETIQTDIPSPLKSHNIPMNSYLGYSLSSGKFFRKRTRHHYVSGAPRASTYKGKVFLFDFPENTDDDLLITLELEGTQMGEYFGGALCVVDLNGDQLDDLVVAAPQYSLSATNSAELVGDEGRIYVYINGDLGKLTEVTGNKMIMGSRRYGARFGTAVANAGDLNMDGFEDIAVGAPFEDNGVVYIYHGHRGGIVFEPVQVIRAENIDQRIKGLGISFSRGVDVDENHYNDLAVGAFDSGHAVVLRGHPIITFEPNLTTSTNRISLKTFSFTCKACLSYKGTFIPDVVEAKVTMQVDLLYGRANFVSKEFAKTNNHTYAVTLRRGKTWCDEFKIEIKEDDRDPTKPIDVVMRYDLANNPQSNSDRRRRQASRTVSDGFCKHCPVVDASQPKYVTRRVAFETGCKGGDICKPDLVVDAKFSGNVEKLVLGEKPTLQMDVVVSNRGEPAFLARAVVVLPKDIPLVRIPRKCQDSQEQHSPETQVLVCDIGNPLKETQTINLVMNTQDVSTDKDSFTFKVEVISVGNEMNSQDNRKELVLPIVVQADVTITGVSSQDQIVYVSQNKTFRKDLMLNHTFEVWNIGPSNVDRVMIELEIPQQFDGPSGKEVFMHILKPEAIMQPSSTTMTCDAVLPYAFWTGDNPITEDISFEVDPTQPGLGEYDETYDGIHSPMSKRSISDYKQKEAVEYSKYSTSEIEYPPSVSSFTSPPSNRTLFLNCSNPQVDCFLVRCFAGPFIPKKSRAVINFQFKAALEVLESSLDMRDIILFSTLGRVVITEPEGALQPKGHKPDGVTVHTMFLGNIPEGSVATWIIALAIICGILILFLIAMVLHKMGFFKREKKEELQALKEAEVDGGDTDGGD